MQDGNNLLMLAAAGGHYEASENFVDGSSLGIQNDEINIVILFKLLGKVFTHFDKYFPNRLVQSTT